MVDVARRVLLQGSVQGCGLRPTLARLAIKHSWDGSIRNTPNGVEFILRGNLPADDVLQDLIATNIPPSAVIAEYACTSIDEVHSHGFQIIDSVTMGPLSTPLPRDRAICSECLGDMRDPDNRRFRYPFTTCARCGPRYSLLTAMPFDRQRTSMQAFDMCADCSREYHDPLDRRFHAQTISCPQCGPQIWSSGRRFTNQAALDAAADVLCRGQIVAMRAVGGYQLLVDATSSDSIGRLRQRKRRPVKPLAVVMPTLAAIRQVAELSPIEEMEVCSAANPIVLLRQLETSALAREINPGLSEVGILLPTTAMHALLLELTGRPLVCTSGNRDGEPLAYRIDEAEQRLQNVADLFLHHDREIQRPIDDSVVRVIANRPVTIRAARGIAPLPLRLLDPLTDTTSVSHILACGGHQKSAIAIAGGPQAVLGPHIGDLDTPSARERWEDHIRQTSELVFNRHITSLACDAHPGYHSTQWATDQKRLPRHVWHHHAHVVAGMLEHQWLDREVLGVAWDGTGLGPDGGIWGGEFLRATATKFQRVACLRPFVLPGGEAAITDLRRLGIALLSQLDELRPDDIARLLDMTERDIHCIQQAMKSSFSPTTTSCGRLFDVAALLILNMTHAAFEGYAAMCLESACDQAESEAYRIEIQLTDPIQLDWRPLIRQILLERRSGVSPGVMAMRFHRGLAQAIIDITGRFPELPVLLGGGAFQNRVLVELVAELWPFDPDRLGLPGVIPPNDGGLAAGQLAVCIASHQIKETRHVPGSSRPTRTLD